MIDTSENRKSASQFGLLMMSLVFGASPLGVASAAPADDEVPSLLVALVALRGPEAPDGVLAISGGYHISYRPHRIGLGFTPGARWATGLTGVVYLATESWVGPAVHRVLTLLSLAGSGLTIALGAPAAIGAP